MDKQVIGLGWFCIVTAVILGLLYLIGGAESGVAVLIIGTLLLICVSLVGPEIIHYGLEKCPHCGKRFSLEEAEKKTDDSGDYFRIRFKCRYCKANRGHRIIEIIHIH